MVLHDIDDLTLQIRNPQVRSYVAEAVRALRAGALRAAVLSLWVAVNSDIIEKIRELALAGDNKATTDIQLLEGWIQRNDIRQLQAFETAILQHANKDYEFLSGAELEALERLQQDRHRCAHPAFSQDGNLYQPSPELVRAHLVNAVQALLMHPPVQGRSALIRLQADLQGNVFPQDQDSVTAYLGPKYLNHGKDVLVSDIVTVHLKQALAATPDISRDRALQVLLAVKACRYDLYMEVMARRWPGLVSGTAVPDLTHVVEVLATDPELWSLVPQAEQIRLTAFVQQLTLPQVSLVLAAAAAVPALLLTARTHLLAMPGDEAYRFLLDPPLPQLVPVALTRLEQARSFREAWQFIDVLQGMLDHLQETDLQRILVATRTNGQIYGAGNISPRLLTLFRSTGDRWPQLAPEWIHLVDDHPKFTSLRAELNTRGWLPPESENEQ